MSEHELWKATLGRTGACPETAMLTGAQLSPEIQQHIATCARCRTELSMLREFEAIDVQAGEMESVEWIESELKRRSPEMFAGAPAPAPIAPRPLFPGWRVLVMATLSVLLLGAGIYWQRGSREQRLTVPSEAPVWRSGQIALLAPVGDITAAPREFRWEAVPGVSSYRLHLLEVDGTEIWTGDSTEPAIVPPAGVATKLTPGRAFQWQVEARNAAGEKIAGASLQSFHILVTSR